MKVLSAVGAAAVLAACSGPTTPDAPQSPSGKLLVVEQSTGATYLVGIADSTRVQVSQFGGPIAASSSSLLTQSGDTVIGFWFNGNEKLIRAASIRDGSVRDLTALPDPVIGGVRALRPDGAKVVLGLVNYGGAEQTEYHELDLSSGTVSPLLRTPPGVRLGEMHWLPDGEHFLADVYRVDNDVTEIRRFSRAVPFSAGTTIPGTTCWRVHSLTVSPNGRNLVFQCTQIIPGTPPSYTVAFKSIGLDGGQAPSLPEDFRSSGQVRFSPDGKFLAYTNVDDRRVWFLRLSTGERWRAVDSDAAGEVADWR